MAIGQRIRQLRGEKGLSQGDIERTTGMLRGYISRVEHGHTVPSLETLERFAGALDVPLYQLFCNPDELSVEAFTPVGEDQSAESQFLRRIKGCIQGLGESDRNLLLDLARKLASR
jgi:transcriptional regulator with XRE-family HTH domain